MVTLCSFGGHVIDRTYLGRVLASPYLLHWTFTIWSIDRCQNRIATDQYPMTISRAQVSSHWGHVIYLEAVRWPVNCFTRSRSMFNLILFRQFGSTEKLIHILDINVVINSQLSKQGIRWLLSLERIAGSGIDASRSSIFWSYPLRRYWFSIYRRLKFNFFEKIHMKYVVFMCRTIKVLISNWPRTRKFSQVL